MAEVRNAPKWYLKYPKDWKNQVWFFFKDGTAATEELLKTYWEMEEKPYFPTLESFLIDLMEQNYVDTPTEKSLIWQMPMFVDDAGTLWHPYELVGIWKDEDTDLEFEPWLLGNFWQSGGNLTMLNDYWAYSNGYWEALKKEQKKWNR